MRYKTLIVGLGQIGMGYDSELDPAEYVYSHARAFSQHPNFQLVGGVDSNPHTREKFEYLYKCPAYPDLETALHLLEPSILVIAAPTHLHSKILLSAINKAPLKAVLCEKPLSYDLPESELMVQACRDQGILLYVNYMRRSDVGVLEVKRRIVSGEIQMPIKGMVWYSKGFLHNGSHFFNLLEYWLGPMQDSEMLSSGRTLDAGDSEPDIQVQFERGSIVFLAAWEEAFSHYAVELLSPSGRLRYEYGGKRIQWQSAQPDSNLRGYTVLSEKQDTIASGMDRYQWHVAEQLALGLNGDDAQLCSGEDALRTLKNMKQILEKI